MRTLWLMRHAKSAWDDPTLADHDRPLNRRGRNAAPRMACILAAQAPLPQFVLCSTAVRTRQTWDLIAPALPTVPVDYRESLYHAATTTLWTELRTISDSIASLLMIGHNPGLEDWLAELTGQRESLPTGALVQLTTTADRWSDLTHGQRCQLINLWRPRELGKQ
jgi:phosphohistidine phosphatase